VSKFTKNEYIKYFGHENNYKKIIPIHNGIEKKNILNDNNPLNKPYLLTVGNVKPNKNLSRLVDAFNKIMDKIPNELVLVGKKSGFISGDEEVLKKVNSFGQRIRMTGFVDDNELQNYYQHAEAFIFPSIYEGFGFPPLEAMATGTPVIASNAASIPEVCGDAALYFNPYDINDMANKIFQMVKNNDMKKEYINKGINQVKKYSWEKTAKKTCDVIMEILKDN
jgi:glycosyltransferase involved in cell wall biosynthesis